MDETCIKVKGRWAYLHRAVNSRGDTIDFHLSRTSNAKAAKRFLGKALRGCKEWEKPFVINTDKAGCPVELGVPVCILEDGHGFILHHEVMWEGSDVDCAVPMVEAAQARFPDLRAVSFDRGFHSPGNRVRLDELLDDNVLPKKGCLNKADLERERDESFAAMRRQHPAVESAINNLGHRGLDRVLAQGAGGFARTVALSVVALNVHRIGLLLLRKARKRKRRAA